MLTTPLVVASPSPAATPSPADAARDLLPDLTVSSPRQIFVQQGADGVREIRFSTTVANRGEGPLVLRGDLDSDSLQFRATQLVERSDGSIREGNVGTFVYDDGHAHWHLPRFFVFELWQLDARGALSAVVASTGKMAFCLADSFPAFEPPPNAAAEARFTSCETATQGISVGWEDIYTADLPGQELDIPGLPDGRYLIRSIVDPDDQLRETDEANNVDTIVVQLDGDSVAEVTDWPPTTPPVQEG